MGPHYALWLRDAKKTFLLYLAVGVAFIPGGLLYALLTILGWNHWAVAILSLAIGFLIAHFAWTRLERRMTAKLEQHGPQATQLAGEVILLPFGQATVAASRSKFISFAFVIRPTPIVRLVGEAESRNAIPEATIVFAA